MRRTSLLGLLVTALGCAPSTVGVGPALDAAGTSDSAPDASLADLPAADLPTADLLAVDVTADANTPDIVLLEDLPSTTDVASPPEAGPTDVPIADTVVIDAPVPPDAPPVPCTRDAQCAAPRPVCDLLRGACAQCTTARPCGSGQTCTAGVCTTAVACTSSRMCPGQVCETTLGRCVDCAADRDCASGERCRANLCVPAPRMCRSSRECSELNQVCHPTQGLCVDCAADNDCLDGVCRTDSTCAPRVCTPNARTCANATAVRVCDARGAATTETNCGANESCSEGQCRPRICTPGAMDCSPEGARRVCNPDGLGYASSACVGSQLCVAGQCVEGCPGGLLRCGGACVDLRTDSANCGGCGVRCGAGEVCAAARSGCMAACVPATVATEISGAGLTVRLPPALVVRQTSTTAAGRGVHGEEASTSIAWLIGRTGTSADLGEAVVRVEGAISQASTVRSLLAGQRFTLADGAEAIEGRVAASCSSATSLRDRLGSALSLPSVGGVSVGADASCVVNYSVTRTSAGEVRVALAVTSRSAYDSAEATARRLRDIAVFGMPQPTATPAAVCATLQAEATPPVDVLWLQDTSGSLAPYQVRVARGSEAFLQRFVAAGLDARVAVVRADAAAQNVESPGLTWVTPAQTGATLALCDRLTSTSLSACPLGGADSTGPYPNTGSASGSSEEPVAASITNATNLVARAARGETNPDRRIRAGARVFTIGLTDESGSNDYTRYFQTQSAPDTMQPWGAPFGPTVITNIAGWFTRNRVMHFGFYPHRTVRCGSDVYDLPRCVASASGGAYADLITTTDGDTQRALTHIVESMAAELSSLRLPAVPQTGLARVTLRGAEVPRSRTDGYDIDPVRRSLVFYGSRYRPMAGEAVSVTFPAW